MTTNPEVAAASIAARLRANVDAWYADDISQDEMRKRNRADWDDAAALDITSDVQRIVHNPKPKETEMSKTRIVSRTGTAAENMRAAREMCVHCGRQTDPGCGCKTKLSGLDGLRRTKTKETDMTTEQQTEQKFNGIVELDNEFTLEMIQEILLRDGCAMSDSEKLNAIFRIVS